jgi:hypothetical protein
MVIDLGALQFCFVALSRPEQEWVIGQLARKGWPDTLLPLVTGRSLELVRPGKASRPLTAQRKFRLMPQPQRLATMRRTVSLSR